MTSDNEDVVAEVARMTGPPLEGESCQVGEGRQPDRCGCADLRTSGPRLHGRRRRPGAKAASAG